jgi:chromosomal replication initiator protein
MILIADVQEAVADLYGLRPEVLREPDGMWGSRERRYARPRQVAMYLARKLCGEENPRAHNKASLSTIGRKFGGRDHSTVLHGCRNIERFMLADTEERRAVGEIGLRFIERER